MKRTIHLAGNSKSAKMLSSSETSYEDLDTSIREQVQQAVVRFATVDDSDPSDEDLPLRPIPTSSEPQSLSVEGLEEEKRKCLQQLRRLEDEVGLLEDEIERRERPVEMPTDEDLERAVLNLTRVDMTCRTTGESSDGSSTTRKEEDRAIWSLKAQLKLNRAISGIKFRRNDCHWEVIHKDSNVLHRKHTHSGSVYGFDFYVEFIVQEEKSNPLEPPDKSRIVAFRTEVDPQAQKELQSFIMRVARDCDLMKFYLTYVKYCLLVNERREAFKKAKAIYSSLIQFSEDSNCLVFQLHTGLSLFFTWSVVVTDRGYINHSMSLQVKAPSNASDDDLAFISTLHLLQEKLVVAHGHEEALLRTMAILQPT